MKLHLPTPLRTALLAAFVGISSAFAADQVQDKAPAAYTALYTQSSQSTAATNSDWIKINYNAPTVANNTNWALTLTAKDITPLLTEVNDKGKQYQYATLISRASLHVRIPTSGNLSGWKLTGEPHAFRIYIAPDGDIALFYQNKTNSYTTVKLDNVKDWDWSSIDELSVTFTYNNDEKCLSLTTGYIRRTEDSETKYFNPVNNIKFDLPANFFTQRQEANNENYLRAAVGAGASLTTSLIYEGTNPGWRIEGWTILDKMIDGSRYYNLTGTQPVLQSLNSAHAVQFLDNKGVIYLENGKYTYSNVTSAIANPVSGASSGSIGFGAAKDAKLTIQRAALQNSAYSTNFPVDVRIVGNGTVELQMNAGDTLNLAELGDAGTLSLNNGGAVNLNITTEKTSSAASITAVKDLTINTGKEKKTRAALGMETNAITVTDGNLTINGDTSAAIIANTISATKKITLKGQYFANRITADGAIQIGSDATYGDNVTASTVHAGTDVEVFGSLKADEIIAKQVITENVSVSSDDGTPTTILEGNVTVDDSGITADNLISADITVGGTTIGDNVSTGSRFGISANAMEATGKLTADALNLHGTYNLKAKEIEAQKVTDGDTTIEGDLLDATSLKDVAIYTNDAGNRVITASSINATTATIGADTILTDANITVKEEINLNDNVTLSNVVFNHGVLTNKANLTLDNFTIVSESSTRKLGGEQGNAIQVTNGIESVQISGALNGGALFIDKLVLNAEELDFSTENNTVSYDIISGNRLTYDYDAERDQINIDPYVRAEMIQGDDGNIKVVGTKDTAGIKQELSDSSNRSAILNAIDEALDTTTVSPLQDIHDYVGHILRHDEASRKDVLSAASGASLTALADSQRRGLRNVQDNLRNRIIQMGGGTSAGLLTDWEYAGIQAWAQADGAFASTSGSGDEWGYDYDTMGATVGANLDLTANTVIGMSFSASYGEINVDGTDHAKGNNDAQYISFFARHNKERWVQMFIFTYGMNDMDMERSVLGYTAKGSTKGSTLSAYYELGYTLGIDYEFEHILQPLVSLSLASASVDSYTEKGSIGDAGINYGNNDYIYGQIAVGARYQGVLYETVHERNAVVEARALITHDFGDTTNEATVALAGSRDYTVKGADSSGMGFKLGAGISIPVEQHTTLYADVDYTSAPDYSGCRGNIGVRYDF